MKYQILTIIIFLFTSQGMSAQDYVITRSNHVNIRTGPTTKSYVVGKTTKSDIFEMVGEQGEWYVIKLFSENPRYINKCCAEKIDGPLADLLGLPENDEKCKSIFTSIQALKFRARREATELIPPTVSEEFNTNMQHILEDMHILNLFEIYGLNPAIYPVLINKAVQNNW